MSVSGVNSGWTPQVSSSLQTEMNNLESSQTSLVNSQVQSDYQNLYTESVNESLPIVNQEATIQSKLTNLQSLASALTTFQQAIGTLGTESTWNGVTATSTNTTAATVTATAGAPSTNVSFSVGNLAQNQVSTLSVSAASANATTSLTAGNLVLSYGDGSGTISVAVTAGESLSDLASAINQQAVTSGIQAGIVQGSSSGGGYELMLSSSKTGTDQSFAIDSSTTTENGTTALALNTMQSAQNASITLGGSGGITLTSSTNTFTNAIPDTSITVNEAGQNGQIQITSDPGTAVSAMTTFMGAYNAISKLVTSGGALANTSIGQEIAMQLPGILVQQNSSQPDGYQSLSQLGVMTTPGTYTISDGTFTATAPPTLEFTPADGIVSGALTSTQTQQSGSATFSGDVSSNASAIESLLGATQTGLQLPSTSILGQLSSSVSTWLNDLNGTTIGTDHITGDIGNLQNELVTGTSAVPGSIGYQLNQLQDQFTDQLQNLLSEWSNAQSGLLQAEEQSSNLSAVEASTSSSDSIVSSLLG